MLVLLLVFAGSVAAHPFEIVVDKDTFHMGVFHHDKKVQSQRVIVGKKSRKTPTFFSTITHIEINPYWNVPPRIATEDMVPKFKKDPNKLISQGFQVFVRHEGDLVQVNPLDVDWSQFSNDKYFIRQLPGVQNAVGLVKFVIRPTKKVHSVMLHGTSMSTHRLFDKPVRTFSSGCIRVEDEISLAQLILNKKSGKMQELLLSGKTIRIKLKTPVRIAVR